MLFDAKHFEQFFDEKPLRRGLRLFEKGRVGFISKHTGTEYEFVVEKITSVLLKKKSDKILSFSCTCKKAGLCEHLAAVLFYLQQDALGFSEKKPGKNSEHNTKPQKANRAGLKTKYGAYAAKVKGLLKPYLKEKVLVQSQLEEIKASVTALLAEADDDILYYLHLALLIELPAVFNLKLMGGEQELKQFLHAAHEELEASYKRGLTKLQADNWYLATLESIKNNSILNSEAFTFLIPRVLNSLKTKKEFEQLRLALNKRKLKKHYLYYFDQLLIAKLQVAVKESELFDGKPISAIYAEETELVIAQAELALCSNKQARAFKILAAKYESIKKTRPYYFNAYLDYVIRKAGDRGRKDLELYYLRESFIHGLGITPAYLGRFIELTPQQEQDEKISAVIAEIKSRPAYVFDKIADLLLSTSRIDELLGEIKKQKNKFSLLHKVAMQKLPYYDDNILAMYSEHLSQAISEAGSYAQQRFLVDKAREYINKLPQPVADQLVLSLCDKVGSFRQIYRYIKL